MSESQPARRPAAAGSDWQDIYLRDTDGGTDVMFDGGVSGWPVHVTGNDLRLIALIKVNLSSKDIATLLGISPDSLRVSRYRLRKKLNLEQGESLTAFVQSL